MMRDSLMLLRRRWAYARHGVRKRTVWPALVSALFWLLTGSGVASAGNFPLSNLGPYYQHAVIAYDQAYYDQNRARFPYLFPRRFETEVWFTGVGIVPDRNVYVAQLPGVYRFITFGYFPDRPQDGFDFFGYRDAVCGSSGAKLPSVPIIDQQVITTQIWAKYPFQTIGNEYANCNLFGGEFGRTELQAREIYTYGAPIRRLTIDGGQYDASPMTLQRNGVPWMSYFWAYRIGLVAAKSDWDGVNAAKVPELVNFFSLPSPANNFELLALPPPRIEDDVVEYVNRNDFPKQPGGQFFYAVRAEDKALLDSVPNWARTGGSFKSGGYVSVCRFYGGKNGGPNTHFYSADDKECAALKSVPQLSYEGQTFAVNMPMPGGNADGTKPCPIDSKPLYRLYNNASYSNGRYVSNHRYTTDHNEVALAVREGWADEGQVMCVPQ